MINLGLIFTLTAAYFAIILGFVVYARLKETKQLLPGLNEFFLAKKNLHPAILAATFTASLFSTFTIIGMPGMTYAQGIGAIVFFVVLDFFGILFVLWIGPKLFRFAQENRVFSPVEIISHAYNSRKLGGLIAIVFSVLLIPYIALQLVGVGAFIDGFTEGQISYVVGVGSMLVVVFIYLFLGGMRAVAYTDFVQLIAMLFGIILGFVFLLKAADISFESLLDYDRQSDASLLSLPGPSGYWTFSMLVSTGIATIGIFCQPHILTRAMMASKVRDIHIFGIVAILFLFVSCFFITGFALFARKQFGDTLEPNMMMGEIFNFLGNQGFVGLCLAGLMLLGALGASMSTADSLLISIGQITTRDLIRPSFRLPPEKQILLSKGIMLVVLVFAFVIGLNPPKLMVDLGIYSGAGCALLIPTIMTMGWKKRSLLAAYVSILSGIAGLVFFAWYKFAHGEALFGVHPGFVPLVLSFVLYFSISVARNERDKHTS